MVAGPHPSPRGIGAPGHLFIGDPPRPVVLLVRHHEGNRPVAAGADGEASRGLPADPPVRVGEDEVQHDRRDLPDRRAHVAYGLRRQDPVQAEGGRHRLEGRPADGHHPPALQAGEDVRDHGTPPGQADRDALFPETAGGLAVLDPQRLPDDLEGDGFPPLEIAPGIGRIDGLHIEVLGVPVGIGHADGDPLRPSHDHPGKARERSPRPPFPAA